MVFAYRSPKGGSMCRARKPSSFCALMYHWACRGGQRASSRSSSRQTRFTRRSWSSLSNIWKFWGNPASDQCCLSSRWASPWKVPTHMPWVGKPSMVSMRRRISRAALLVKVTASTALGETPSARISQAIRCTRTRVLPEPAPASTRRLPGSAATASRCAALRSAKISDTSMVKVYRKIIR